MNLHGSKKPSKTLDIGFNGVSLSTDSLGTILQISVFHPEHGVVLAEPYEQFDGSRFRDTPYVREYRARMLKSIETSTRGFGICFDVQVQNVQVDLDGLGRARISYSTSDGFLITTSLQISRDAGVIQSSEITSTTSSTANVRYTMNLGVSVNRASYGQLTEGGPIPIPPSENRVGLQNHGQDVVVVNPHLSAHLQGCLKSDGKPVDLRGDIEEKVFHNAPVAGDFSRMLEVPAKESRRLMARFTLRPGTTCQTFSDDEITLSVGLPSIWPTSETTGRFIVRRNLEYILGNCSIPLSPLRGVVCLITDHVALPLGWMRDNYWQVRFLMDVHRNLDDLADERTAKAYLQMIRDTIKGHLVWIYRYAQRPHQYWHRSYLTTGRPKDGAVFQLDQQCYPLLEICDFWETFPEEQDLVQSILSEDVIFQVLSLIESKKDQSTGLFATDETPGDDAVEHPFHFSSHVLLWHALSKLAKLTSQLPNCSQLCRRLRVLADDVRVATVKHFLCLDPDRGKTSFAYLVDGQSHRTFYHDANDLPTLFAPVWGFVKTDIERQAWHNTMEFAFSVANDGGYYGDGPFGGLGSVHTRDPWPLGYFQSWRYAQMTGNIQEESAAWRKICGCMLWDGLFSEAVDGQTGECTSKAWFSWPGSMIGSRLLQPGVRERYL
ncbi:uncharacterized protein Z518_04649 [Rhinocladiella mackenziei CBS 650.93]|uniref:Alpha,alpha-trehalase n=1 Tax=Rhinocladiella mackenziei CBS 650.93 TaxID=1442369 RepID=A0A0D2H8A9_9EURO|nr:uncharacterized protein Z518_04649 [Rhinocladiella mackenziei CBS 650.93]KIX06673.1 hypothetical protein Z518_04649 [Rhinocladiella mackenziei CBS 650.93]